MDRYLVLLPKYVEVCFFDGRNEVFNYPQGKYYKFLKSIGTYDGLCWGFSTI